MNKYNAAHLERAIKKKNREVTLMIVKAFFLTVCLGFFAFYIYEGAVIPAMLFLAAYTIGK